MKKFLKTSQGFFKGEPMKQSRIILIVTVMLFLTSTASAQNFAKVIEIVGNLEDSMSVKFANEALIRSSEINTIKTDLAAIKKMLINNAQSDDDDVPNNIAAESRSIIDRIVLLEQRANDTNTTISGTRVSLLLDQLIVEFKKVMEEEHKSRQKIQEYTINGQMRHRGELDGRSFIPDARTLSYNLLRTRVNMQFSPNEATKVFVQLQDSRLFGGGNSTLLRGTQDAMAKNIDFHQAYFSLKKLFDSPITIKLGRQEMLYGKQRLISPSNWNNVGTTFDAAVIQWSSGDIAADMFSAKLVGSQTNTIAENFRGIHSTIKNVYSMNTDLFLYFDNNTTAIVKGADAGKDRLSRYTTGITLSTKQKPFDGDLEYILQRGSIGINDSASASSIEAWLFSVTGNYTVSEENKLKVGLLLTIMSGDDDQAKAPFTTFHTLFTSLHTFLGYMDYFPKTLTQYGIQDAAIQSSIQPLTTLGIMFDAHYFSLNKDAAFIISPSEKVLEKKIGYEFDVTITHNYSQPVTLVAGVSLFVPEKGMQYLMGHATAYWGYVMTIINF